MITFTHPVWIVKLKHRVAMSTRRGEAEANLQWRYKTDTEAQCLQDPEARFTN
jgi:hypothetical protein